MQVQGQGWGAGASLGSGGRGSMATCGAGSPAACQKRLASMHRQGTKHCMNSILPQKCP